MDSFVNNNVVISFSFLPKGEGKFKPSPFRSLLISISVALSVIFNSPLQEVSPLILFAQFSPNAERINFWLIIPSILILVILSILVNSIYIGLLDKFACKALIFISS